MTMRRVVQIVLGLCMATAGVASTAAAQSNDEVFPFGFEWNFSTPGARANGMGRTFIGIADDGTAPISNPAGLMSLTKPQVYGEFKSTNIQVDRLASVESLFTLQTTTFESTVNAFSFLSLSAPIKNTRLAVGFSIHRYLDYQESFSLDPRPIPALPSSALRPVNGSTDFTGTNYSGTVAFMVTNALRVGGTFGAATFNADTTATRNVIAFGPSFPTVRTDLRGTSIVANQSSINDSQTAPSFSLGALYRINDMFQVGGNYAKGPKFTTSETLQVNLGQNLSPPVNQTPLVTAPGFPKPVPIDVPDHFGGGFSARPTPRLLVGADVVRTLYSSLTKTVTLIFNDTTLTGGEFSTPDTTEFHVGAEYNVLNLMQGKSPLFVRGGFYSNPSHVITFTGASDAATNAVMNAQYNLAPRNDEYRGTVGGGVVLGSRVQVDAAYVFGKEFVLSSAVRF
ncbi:MAG TPA: outer membrane protein transport protein [Vicinamibacterales bacterium]|nr:outer membrane protein transport protein [Vicinamibacterales bacterium]